MRRGLVTGLGVVAAAAAVCGVSASGSGHANRSAFLADVARRLDIDPRASFGAGGAWASPALEERIRERLGPRGGGPPVDLRLLPYPHRGLSVIAAAGYLGMPEWQLRSELRSGASLADLATAHGKSVEGLQEAIAAETQRQLASLHNLSDVQREQLLNRVIGQLDEIVRRDGRPAGWGARGGP